ncbi:hypothetical protein KDL45_04170, partial [bacterium]|nr:hypothetical protein [bacterium]
MMSKSFRVATSVRVARIIAVCLALTFATACGDLLSNDTQDRPTSTPSQSESVFYAPGSADDESPVVDISMDAALSADQSRIASEQLAGPEVVTSRFFLLDTETLRNDEDSYLRLQLPDDRRLVFKTTGVLTRENGFTWYGRIVAGGKGLAYLSVVDGDAAGQIFGARGRFVVRPLAGGAHAIYQVDQSAYAACGMPPGEDLPAHTDGMVEPTDFGADIAADDGSVIDVLVAYTPGAASQTGNIAADIQAAIDDANNAYRLSAISTRLNLVHTVQVDYEDSLDQCADRDALQDPDDGEMDDVHTLRDTYGADLVALLTKSGLYCGCAYVPDALDVANEDIGFSATAINCAIGNHSFAHEIGHNFGARHDRDADPIENKPTAYNHGSSLEKNSSGWFRTIMSYDRAGKCGDSPSKPDCERLPLFSSPNIFYGSRPRLGRVEYYSTGTYDYEDNARMHNEAASYVANYRAGSDARPPLEDETNSEHVDEAAATCPTQENIDVTFTPNPPYVDEAELSVVSNLSAAYPDTNVPRPVYFHCFTDSGSNIFPVYMRRWTMTTGPNTTPGAKVRWAAIVKSTVGQSTKTDVWYSPNEITVQPNTTYTINTDGEPFFAQPFITNNSYKWCVGATHEPSLNQSVTWQGYLGLHTAGVRAYFYGAYDNFKDEILWMYSSTYIPPTTTNAYAALETQALLDNCGYYYGTTTSIPTTTTTTVPPEVDDIYEENDFFGQASAISGSYFGVYLGDSIKIYLQDEDFYKIALNGSFSYLLTNISLIIYPRHKENNISACLYDESQNLLDCPDGDPCFDVDGLNSNMTTCSFEPINSKTVYVRVYSDEPYNGQTYNIYFAASTVTTTSTTTTTPSTTTTTTVTTTTSGSSTTTTSGSSTTTTIGSSTTTTSTSASTSTTTTSTTSTTIAPTTTTTSTIATTTSTTTVPTGDTTTTQPPDTTTTTVATTTSTT